MPDHTSVSVIIPVYNVENYLDRCIKSVASQSYFDLDIVLVDDGSTDQSTMICQEWAQNDNRVTYIRQENAGLGPARNRGLKAARSDYITFLDSDDWLEPEYIEKIISAMLADGSDVGQCDIYYVDSATLSRQTVKLRYNSRVVSCGSDKSVVNKSRLFAWGKIFKRGLLDNCGFLFPAIAFEDTCIPVLIASSNQISYVPEPLINYFRGRPDSLSNHDGKISDIAKGLQLLYEKMNQLNLYPGYELEYKKIVLGQLRFACRKWSGADGAGGADSAGDTDAAGNIDAAVADALKKLEQFAADKFPNLKLMPAETYYAFGTELLKTALDYALPRGEQLASDIKSADCIVAYEHDIPYLPETSARILELPIYEQKTKDPVSAAFDLAELIMERL